MNSMETITVFKDSYEKTFENELKYMSELARLKGTIIALADIMDSNPEYVSKELKRLVATDFEM